MGGSAPRRRSTGTGLPRASPAETGDGRVVRRQHAGPSFVSSVEPESGDVVNCEHNRVETFDLCRAVRVDLAVEHAPAWFRTD